MPDKKQNQAKAYSNRDLIKDVASYIKPYRWRFLLGSILRLSGDLVNLYPTFALASIVTFFSKYRSGDSLDYFWKLAVFWVIAANWRNISVFLGKYLIFQIAERTALDSQLKAVRHLFRLDMAWHERENSGNKLKRIQRGGSALDRIIRMWVINYIEIAVNFIGMIYILSRIDLGISMAMAVFMAAYFSLSFFLLRKASALVQEVNVKEEEISGLMFQSINNIRSVKISGMAGTILGMLEEQTKNIFSVIKKRIFRFQFRGGMLDFWTIIFRLGALVFIALGIANGHYEVGFLILFNGYFLRIRESVSELSNTTQDLIINRNALGRLKEIFDEPARIDDDSGKVDFPENWEKITVRNLCFAYGEKEVLNNISFEIKKGERVGIVGLSGAGKSTLFKLLLKENENFRGEIMFDSLSIRDIKKYSYYRETGVVLQETDVFNFSLRDNITIASDEAADEDRLRQALDISHVSDFARRLPEGLGTYIGEKGVRLSGGEKQRLGIARAIYKQPQLLFLDEATSHLDLESEAKIKDSLHAFFRSVTAIVIAHRLTTIKELDRILVIENGALAESGSFEELYRKKGRFYELWEKQKL